MLSHFILSAHLPYSACRNKYAVKNDLHVLVFIEFIFLFLFVYNVYTISKSINDYSSSLDKTQNENGY